MSKVDETQALWLRYRDTRDQGLRNRLLLTYAPLVKYVAGRLGSGLPAHVDESDLASYGLLGLIGAIERYDPERDVKFETYAIARIKGAIIDELRAMDWVPRSVRSRARAIGRAMSELEGKLGRAPTDAEISAKLGISEDELEESLSDIGRSSIAALDELWTVAGSGGDQVALIDTIEDESAPDPQQTLSQTELREAIADAIARLPEREKLVVTLEEEMYVAAEELRFEYAAKLRDEIKELRRELLADVIDLDADLVDFADSFADAVEVLVDFGTLARGEGCVHMHAAHEVDAAGEIDKEGVSFLGRLP